MSLRERLPPALRAVLPGAVWVAVGSLAFVTILDAVLEGGDISSWDQPLLRWMVSIRSSWFTDLMTLVTNMFDPVILLIMVVIASVIWNALSHRRRDPVLLVGAIVTSTLLSAIVKVLVHRPRPPQDLQIIPGFETSFSFPSGHSTGASTLVLVTGYLLWRQHGGRGRFALWMAASGLIILLVGGSRLYLGYHFLSDVLAGACLGMVTLGLVVAASRLLDLRADLRAGQPPGRGHVPSVGSDTNDLPP